LIIATINATASLFRLLQVVLSYSSFIGVVNVIDVADVVDAFDE